MGNCWHVLATFTCPQHPYYHHLVHHHHHPDLHCHHHHLYQSLLHHHTRPFWKENKVYTNWHATTDPMQPTIDSEGSAECAVPICCGQSQMTCPQEPSLVFSDLGVESPSPCAHLCTLSRRSHSIPYYIGICQCGTQQCITANPIHNSQIDAHLIGCRAKVDALWHIH